MNITYLAILEPGDDGSYSVSFPDLPGCFSFGENLTEAAAMATEAAELHVYGMEKDGEPIPQLKSCEKCHNMIKSFMAVPKR